MQLGTGTVSAADLAVANAPAATPKYAARKNPNWGAYQSDHVYGAFYAGAGKAIDAGVNDDNYADNAGTMTLDVYAPPTLTTVSVSASAPTAIEQDPSGNPAAGQFDVRRAGDLSFPITVNLGLDSTVTNPATADEYQALPASVSFAAGQADALVSVNPLANHKVEGNKTVGVVVQAGTGYTVGGQATAAVNIVDTDDATITLGAVPTLAAGQTYTVPVTVTDHYGVAGGLEAGKVLSVAADDSSVLLVIGATITVGADGTATATVAGAGAGTTALHVTDPAGNKASANVSVVQLNSLTLTDNNNSANTAQAMPNGSEPTLFADVDSSGDMSVHISADASPNPGGYASLDYQVLDINGNVLTGKPLGQVGADAVLASGAYTLKVGFDPNGTGVLAPGAQAIQLKNNGAHFNPNVLTISTAAGNVTGSADFVTADGTARLVQLTTYTAQGGSPPVVANLIAIGRQIALNPGFAGPGRERVEFQWGGPIPPVGTTYTYALSVQSFNDPLITASLIIQITP